jgi:hypothetical protein
MKDSISDLSKTRKWNAHRKFVAVGKKFIQRCSTAGAGLSNSPRGSSEKKSKKLQKAKIQEAFASWRLYWNDPGKIRTPNPIFTY